MWCQAACSECARSPSLPSPFFAPILAVSHVRTSAWLLTLFQHAARTSKSVTWSHSSISRLRQHACAKSAHVTSGGEPRHSSSNTCLDQNQLSAYSACLLLCVSNIRLAAGSNTLLVKITHNHHAYIHAAHSPNTRMPAGRRHYIVSPIQHRCFSLFLLSRLVVCVTYGLFWLVMFVVAPPLLEYISTGYRCVHGILSVSMCLHVRLVEVFAMHKE